MALRGKPSRCGSSELDLRELLLLTRRLADDGLKARKQVIQSCYEGLAVKGSASPYR